MTGVATKQETALDLRIEGRFCRAPQWQRHSDQESRRVGEVSCLKKLAPRIYIHRYATRNTTRLDSRSRAPESLGGSDLIQRTGMPRSLTLAQHTGPVKQIQGVSEMRKPCITPGCGLMVSHPSPRRTRCADCEARYQHNRNRRPERAVYRDPAYKAAVRWGVCHICGEPGADTRDHVVPISRGGTNHPSNLRPAHRACNSRKGAK